MAMEPIKIDITSEKTRFDRFISLPDNERIIFSGAFGIGKSYFIDEYFNENSKYEAIILRPVNYVVSSNEDIFEYIKFDIALELLGKDITLKKEKFSDKLVLPMYLQEHDDLFSILATYVGKTGKQGRLFEVLFKAIKKVIEKYDEYQKFKEATSVDQKKEIKDFIITFKDKKGSIFEENAITELISLLIDSLKENTRKEVVLVVDDLDRLDPEHIFRLLNVFAAHADYYEKGNFKFAIDKIVFVCDIANIRNIYHARYGDKVDFSGYIDKFYSREVYEFDNSELVSRELDSILKRIKSSNTSLVDFYLNGSYLKCWIECILNDMIKYNAINLRSLLKYCDVIYEVKTYSFYIDNTRFYSNDFLIVVLFDFLKSLFGNVDNLKETLYRCAELSPEVIGNNDRCYRDILNHSFTLLADFSKVNNNNALIYKNKELNIYIEYKFIHNMMYSTEIEKKRYLDSGESIEKVNYFRILSASYEKYLTLKKTK